jgi:hypothetical protein
MLRELTRKRKDGSTWVDDRHISLQGRPQHGRTATQPPPGPGPGSPLPPTPLTELSLLTLLRGLRRCRCSVRVYTKPNPIQYDIAVLAESFKLLSRLIFYCPLQGPPPRRKGVGLVLRLFTVNIMLFIDTDNREK